MEEPLCDCRFVELQDFTKSYGFSDLVSWRAPHSSYGLRTLTSETVYHVTHCQCAYHHSRRWDVSYQVPIIVSEQFTRLRREPVIEDKLCAQYVSHSTHAKEKYLLLRHIFELRSKHAIPRIQRKCSHGERETCLRWRWVWMSLGARWGVRITTFCDSGPSNCLRPAILVASKLQSDSQANFSRAIDRSGERRPTWRPRISSQKSRQRCSTYLDHWKWKSQLIHMAQKGHSWFAQT